MLLVNGQYQGRRPRRRREAGWRTPIISWLTRKLHRAMAVREAAKSAMIAAASPSKRVALEIGRRLVEAGHLDNPQHVLRWSICSAGSKAGGMARASVNAADRARQREAWLAEDPPADVITEEPDGRVSTPAAVVPHAGDAWSGIGAAPGRARGVARIIHHPDQGRALAAGEVLVAPSTDPGWTPLFLRASAIVMASGGYLSHGAIVAREYGIPAVVNIPGILSEMRQGDMVVVDGDNCSVVRETPRHTV